MSVFADTNILLYAASGRPADAAKTARAGRIAPTDDIVISFQVPREFSVNATNPRKLGLTPRRPPLTVACG